ncbi:endonuclease domain-containing 1 -like protein [Labeo rohita]|uniref:Endonuclease domain-containing 1-like protein n=1 Tax=Labeo rohita TaxID=84645 RepID=A0A498M2H9_LABRO|nr:endonuclease domain-containing 1 -like protein [Labeo rohita]
MQPVKAPFWSPFSPSAIVSNLICTSSNGRGSPFRCSRATAPFGRSVSPPSVVSSYAAYSVSDGALPPGAAEPQAPFGCSESPPSEASNHASYSAARGTLPSSAAEPQLPSDAVRVPPSLALNFFTYSTSDGAPSTGAAEPRLPSVAAGALHLIHCCKRDSPFRCSRAAAPFGSSESPSFDICHHAPPLGTCRAHQSDTSSRSSRQTVQGFPIQSKVLTNVNYPTINQMIAQGTMEEIKSITYQNNFFEKQQETIEISKKLIKESSWLMTEVVSDFRGKCAEFFANGISPTILPEPQYKKICQTLKGKVHYATLYNTYKKIPVYSAYKFNKRISCERKKSWCIEPQLDDAGEGPNMVPEPFRQSDNQAVSDDYKDSGYDKGHLAPVFLAGSQGCADATFTLTNAAPQDPSFNRDIFQASHYC